MCRSEAVQKKSTSELADAVVNGWGGPTEAGVPAVGVETLLATCELLVRLLGSDADVVNSVPCAGLRLCVFDIARGSLC